MLRTLNSMLGYRLDASDGPAGTLHDLLFDDVSWRIRHLVAHFRHHRGGHGVLIDPSAIRDIDWVQEHIKLALTCDDEIHGPSEDTHEPVFRQYEEQAANYGQWASQWPAFSGVPEPNPEVVVTGDVHLRSVRHLCGYKLYGRGARIGHVIDFVGDDADWTVPMIVAGVGHFWDEKPVLVPTDAIHAFVWQDKVLRIDLDVAVVADAPAFNPMLLNDRRIIEEVHDRFAVRVRTA